MSSSRAFLISTFSGRCVRCCSSCMLLRAVVILFPSILYSLKYLDTCVDTVLPGKCFVFIASSASMPKSFNLASVSARCCFQKSICCCLPDVAVALRNSSKCVFSSASPDFCATGCCSFCICPRTSARVRISCAFFGVVPSMSFILVVNSCSRSFSCSSLPWSLLINSSTFLCSSGYTLGLCWSSSIARRCSPYCLIAEASWWPMICTSLGKPLSNILSSGSPDLFCNSAICIL